MYHWLIKSFSSYIVFPRMISMKIVLNAPFQLNSLGIGHFPLSGSRIAPLHSSTRIHLVASYSFVLWNVPKNLASIVQYVHISMIYLSQQVALYVFDRLRKKRLKKKKKIGLKIFATGVNSEGKNWQILHITTIMNIRWLG